LQDNQEELKNWKKIVHIAKKSGEIKTTMTDEQVAKLFIYSSDGFGIHLIMIDPSAQKMDKFKSELQSIWDGLYSALKA